MKAFEKVVRLGLVVLLAGVTMTSTGTFVEDVTGEICVDLAP